ncbi:MAG: UDP-glucuronic acid decarboxylase family protein [Pseudomonadota bacterium]
MLPRRKVLVTGAAGFIGSHLCDRLLAQGDEVVGVDNFFTGRAENIHPLHNQPLFEMLTHDVAKPYWAQVDQVYNLACPASPRHYQAQPIDTMQTSFMGAVHALEIAKACKATVLQASSSEVYGDPLVHPQPEDYWGNVNPFGVRACYDEGKRSAEALFYSYRATFGVDARVARIFNTYGPRMSADDGRVVSNFIVQALQNQDITIYGDGSQTRSFCYIDDLVDGLMRLMNCDISKAADPCNLGNPDEYTVRQLAETVLELTGSKSRIVFEDLPQDDPKLRQPNIDRATKRLGWKPKVKLIEGLAKTIAYFEMELASPAPGATSLKALQNGALHIAPGK